MLMRCNLDQCKGSPWNRVHNSLTCINFATNLLSKHIQGKTRTYQVQKKVMQYTCSRQLTTNFNSYAHTLPYSYQDISKTNQTVHSTCDKSKISHVTATLKQNHDMNIMHHT